MKKTKKRFVSLFLAIAICFSMAFPVSASGSLSATVPAVPEGYTYSHYVIGNRNVDMAIIDSVLFVIGLIPTPAALAVTTAIAVINGLDRSTYSQATTYVDFVYECDDPISQGVPYIYWHKIRWDFVYIDDDGNETVYHRWSSYYEYAVMPK